MKVKDHNWITVEKKVQMLTPLPPTIRDQLKDRSHPRVTTAQTDKKSSLKVKPDGKQAYCLVEDEAQKWNLMETCAITV